MGPPAPPFNGYLSIQRLTKYTYTYIYICIYMYIYISTLYEIWNSSTSNIKTANYDDFFLILLSKKNQFFFDTSLLYVCFVGSRSPRPVHEVCWRHGRDMLQHGKGVFYLHLYVLLAFASPTCIMSFLSFLWVYIPVLHVSYV